MYFNIYSGTRDNHLILPGSPGGSFCTIGMCRTKSQQYVSFILGKSQLIIVQKYVRRTKVGSKIFENPSMKKSTTSTNHPVFYLEICGTSIIKIRYSYETKYTSRSSVSNSTERSHPTKYGYIYHRLCEQDFHYEGYPMQDSQLGHNQYWNR